MTRWALLLLAACTPGEPITMIMQGCDGAAAVTASYDRLEIDHASCSGTVRLCTGDDCMPVVTGGNPAGDECDTTESAFCASTHTSFVFDSFMLTITVLDGGPPAGSRASFTCPEGFQLGVVNEPGTCTSRLMVRTN